MLYNAIMETFGNGLGGIAYIVITGVSLYGIKAAFARTFGR